MAAERRPGMSGDALVMVGSSNPTIGRALLERLRQPPVDVLTERFPDGELHVHARAPLRGRDVYLLQALSAPVGEHLLELVLLGDAARRAGAARVCAMIPYFGYGRHDRRAHEGEPLGAKVVAHMLDGADFARILVVDLHAPAVEGCFAAPVEHLTAVPLLADALRPHAAQEAVVVSPDLGGVKLAERYASALGLPLAMVHKTRTSPTEVAARGVVGRVRGRLPILVDDMISTAGTLHAAVQALRAEGCTARPVVAASHALLVGDAVERLRSLDLARILVTDSVEVRRDLPLPLEVVSLAPLLARAVVQLHQAGSTEDLLSHR